MIPYSRQTLDKKDQNAVLKTLKSSFLTQGPLINKFEKQISKTVGAKFAAVVNSATSALHVSCMALGFQKNNILWTTPNTFVASSNCAIHLGGKVDFVDIDYDSGNMCVEKLERKLFYSKKKNLLPKIVIPVHFQETRLSKIIFINYQKNINLKLLKMLHTLLEQNIKMNR